MIRHGYAIEKEKIPQYINNEESLSAIMFWQRFKTFGFPIDEGWALQPAVYVETIILLEQESMKREKAGKL